MSEAASTPTFPNSDRAEMNDVIAHLNTVLNEDEATATATSPSGRRLRWITDVVTDDDEHVVGFGVISSGDIAGVAEAYGLERGTGEHVADHIARHDPARTLREVEALRRVIEDYRMADRACMRSNDPMSPEYATIRAGRDALKGVLLAYAEATGRRRTD